ncbi:Octopamine receptor beta-2R [Bulinus truncatus]|nr:Octopamine receptor beta-2R [Bulinus truncatus]
MSAGLGGYHGRRVETITIFMSGFTVETYVGGSLCTLRSIKICVVKQVMSIQVNKNGNHFGAHIGQPSSDQKLLKNMRILDVLSSVLSTDAGNKDSLLSPGVEDTGQQSLELDTAMPFFQGKETNAAESKFAETASELELGVGNFTLGDVFSPVASTVIPELSEWSAAEIGAVAIVILMVPFILCSNLLVILSVVRYRRLHTPTNYFVTSLAAVDVLVALAVPFVVVVDVFDFGGADGPWDVVLCLLPNRVLMMACGVSVLTLATIAYDRHTALVSPLEYVTIMTTRKVAVMVAVTWVYSTFIVWLPLMIGWFSTPGEPASCSSNLLSGKASVLFLGAIFIPSCVAILVCYSRIFLVARHHAKAIAAVEFAIHRNIQFKFMIKDTKYAKTLALVIGFFLALWLPYLIYIFIQTVCHVRFDIWIQTYLILLAVFNSGINPWIYAFKNNEFRAAFRRMFRELCRDRMCKGEERRASLVPTVSNTPRLSRTDSRMLSNLLESTLDILTEQLKSSIGSFNDSSIDRRLYDVACIRSDTNVPDNEALVSPVLGFKKLVRHTASCSELDSYTQPAPKKGEGHKVMERSHSVDYCLTHFTVSDILSQECRVGDKPSAVRSRYSDSNICESSAPVAEMPLVDQTLLTERFISQASLVDISSSSSSGLPVVLSSSTSSVATSSLSHINASLSHCNTLPSQKNTLPSQMNTLPSHVPLSHTGFTQPHPSLLSLQATSLPLSAVGAYTLPYYPQHHISTTPQPSCHPLRHVCAPQTPPPSTAPHPPPGDINQFHSSFCIVNEETPGHNSASSLHCPQYTHPETHDGHPALSHTHSCPAFDPGAPHPSHLLPYWEKSLLCSYLETLGIPKNTNYVSRLDTNDRYNTKFFI